MQDAQHLGKFNKAALFCREYVPKCMTRQDTHNFNNVMKTVPNLSQHEIDSLRAFLTNSESVLGASTVTTAIQESNFLVAQQSFTSSQIRFFVLALPWTRQKVCRLN